MKGAQGVARKLSCGVVVTDGAQILLGHATRSTRWDIPKGLAEPGEDAAAAASRELREETGLDVAATLLVPLGRHVYLRDKDLALFAWRVASMPDPRSLVCTAMVRPTLGAAFPEFDRFAVLAWADALARVGRSLAQVLEVAALDHALAMARSNA